MSTVVQLLDAVADEAARAEHPDAHLLDLFVRARDPAAFALLVRRHGPMVLGVRRRVLRNAADADDAFQTAFLVLARKAGRVGDRHRLAQWLYGVAFNTARKLRRTNARRAARVGPIADAPELPAPAADAREELLAILDEELARLPERYRAVVVLCDLEGLTRREAARELACPEGTVAGRLARARALLAQRLTARGVSAAALLAVVLAERAAVAASTVSAVVGAVGVDSLASAAASGLISTRVAETTEGVLRAMFQSKIRTAAILCGGLVLACAAGLTHFASAQPTAAEGLYVPLPGGPPAADKPAPAKPGEPVSTKALTVFPLKKLDPAATAKVIADAYKDKGVTVAPAASEKLLFVYADPKTTAEIRALLEKLGEAPPANAVVIRLAAGANPAEVASALDEVFNGPAANRQSRVTIVPLANANALLVYASPLDLRAIEKLLEKLLHQYAPADPEKPAAEPKWVTLKMVRVAWADVFAWYAEQTGLTLATKDIPTGSFTHNPPGIVKYTLVAVTDLINEALIAQKWLLIRDGKTFSVVPADEKIDPRLARRVPLADLAMYGKTELVEVVISLKLSGPDAKPLVPASDLVPTAKRMLSPFGHAEVHYYTGSRDDQLLVRDVAANVVKIVKAVRDIEDAAAKKQK